MMFGTNMDWFNNTYINDKESQYYNAQRYIDAVKSLTKQLAKIYKTKHILMMCGEDFEWSVSEKIFYSLDRLMNDFNA